MKLIKVAATVLNQTPFDWAHNKQNILEAIGQARSEQVSILCLPELCITGYGCEDMFHSPAVQRMAVRVLHEIVPATDGMVVCVGLPLMHHNGLFNTAALLVNGSIAGFVAKRFLAGEGIHYEPRWFKPWPQGLCGQVEVDGQRYPMGDLYFEIGGVRLGFEICEDAWVAARPGSSLSLKGADMILNPSASHFAFGKLEVRKRFVVEGSRAFGVTYVYANLLGNESGRAIYDGGALIASAGRMVASGPRFSFKDCVVTPAVIDVDHTRMSQARTPSFTPELGEDEACFIKVDFRYPPIQPAVKQLVEIPWEQSPNVKEEEFTRAVSLGLFDYMRKSRSIGFVVSLSGGADSAAIASLVKTMVDIGVAELGLDGFLEKISYVRQDGRIENARDLVRLLLACAYQSTENSSPTTRNAARAVAGAVGAEYYELDVDRLVKDYVSLVSKAIGRELTWKSDDVALQNIQARVRSPGIWLLANLRSALLVATSNRSEAAVGYATMDGDTCGGISPIAGIDKAFLKKWLLWMETDGPLGLAPVSTLSLVNSQAPTAELRPLEQAQTDEKDLMPYPVLDFIERAAIRDKQSPLEVFLLLRIHFGEYSQEELCTWVERFFRLWCRNQWKRERYAPSFHLDDANLDPKTWCRFPILSGGFDAELAELRAFVEQEKQAMAAGRAT
jgi:NAD+ synthase (glutamine-hydrolysing)